MRSGSKVAAACLRIGLRVTTADATFAKLGLDRLRLPVRAAFALDGGAMFGVVPRVLWEKVCPPDELNRAPRAGRAPAGTQTESGSLARGPRRDPVPHQPEEESMLELVLKDMSCGHCAARGWTAAHCSGAWACR